MSTSPPTPWHTVTIPLSSAVLEALTSILFELLLLGALALLAQSLCAHYNLRRLYDEKQPIKIGSPILPLRVHAPIGHLPLSILLAAALFLAALMNNVLSFSINGRSEPVHDPAVLPYVITGADGAGTAPISSTVARALRIDYEDEFEPVDTKEGEEAKAPHISARLRAVRLADQCLFCNYTKCSIYAFAVSTPGTLNKTLIDPDAEMPSTCITTDLFENDRVWLSYDNFQGKELSPNETTPSRFLAINQESHTEVPPNLPNAPTNRQEAEQCDIAAVDADFPSDAAQRKAVFADAKLTTATCNVGDLLEPRCFSRRGSIVTKCAAVFKLSGGGLKVLLFDAPTAADSASTSGEGGSKKVVSPAIDWVTNGHLLPASEYKTYTSNVAYMASIELTGMSHLLQRMATTELREDVKLQRRRMGADGKDEQKLLSDVDLRIALPGLIYNVLLLVVLASADAWMWYAAVYSKDRQGFNALASVPDVLQVLNEESTDRRRGGYTGGAAEEQRAGVQIGVDQPVLGVAQSRREDLLHRKTTAIGVTADDWDEVQIS